MLRYLIRIHMYIHNLPKYDFRNLMYDVTVVQSDYSFDLFKIENFFLIDYNESNEN